MKCYCDLARREWTNRLYGILKSQRILKPLARDEKEIPQTKYIVIKTLHHVSST